jgi:hypothetical protein
MQFQAALSIGFFLGVIFVMTQQMLILFVIFTERSANQSESAILIQAQKAMASFAFFLFFVYGFFGSVLAIFRNDIIKTGEAHPKLHTI